MRRGIVAFSIVLAFEAMAAQRPIQVLATTGDWKNQPWYQNLWMRDKEGKPQIYRGRYIEQKVEAIAPGRFAFTHIPNYIAQQYLDADYLSQFDVLLIGDLMVHLSDQFQTAVRDFVRNGGGLIYCANHKWGIGMKVKGQPFEEALPTAWPEANEWGEFENWVDVESFMPDLLSRRHPIVRGLDWAAAPPLGRAVNMPAKKGATVLLATPRIAVLPWQVIGPWPNPGGTGGWDVAYEPERKIDLSASYTVEGQREPLRWQRARARGTGVLDLNKLLTPNDNVLAYAVLYVKSPDARKVLCAGFADDGIKVWVNGKQLPGDPKKAGAWPGKAEAELARGWNEVLIKCVEKTGWWGFKLELLTPDGKPMPDLAFSYKPAAMRAREQEYVEQAPVLTAWDFGRGRAVFSASIFANDEQSEKFAQGWQDFGKYYAQLFEWVGANSKNQRATLRDAQAEVRASVDFTRPLNAIAPGIFSIHGNEGIRDVALENYMALNPKGAISRGYPDATAIEGVPAGDKGDKWEPQNDNDDPNVTDWSRINKKGIDAYIAECQAYGTEPILCCHGIQYGSPKWMWKEGHWLGEATERDAAEIAEMVGAFLEHANRGRKGSPNYELNVKYVDLGNEPELDHKSLPGWVRIVKAVGQRVHRDHPGVLVGSYAPYQMRYIRQLLDEAGGEIDWLSFHPYGWTASEFYRFTDGIQAYARSKGLSNLKLMITEWDFWIQGREKFDYMMTRWFASVPREDLLGTIHYRLWQYVEPIYMFGVLWAGWGPKDVVGPRGTPIHDAYDAFWIWRDFRGRRVATTKALASADTSPRLLDHLHLDASENGGKLNALLYYGWAYDGTGYKDYAKGIAYPRVKVSLKLALPPATAARNLTISRATGEGFEVLAKGVAIPAGAKEHVQAIEAEPLTAYSITVE
ncbi:MAG TPA: hypothetical protein PLE19_17705 [Planctomycetota bacterium]|nr:hypothetical protein [Planctomycetota bacterium]HRR80744.1 hypothetical protein [Planctomycetota bacterium]HRT95444.1 hypothetical protein [Planctomycetota bacterium]